MPTEPMKDEELRKWAEQNVRYDTGAGELQKAAWRAVLSLLDRVKERAEIGGLIHPITCVISIGAEDWDYMQRALRTLTEECAKRDPETFQMMSGGGGGSYAVTTVTRPISKEEFRKELDDWFTAYALPTPPAETETK